MVKREYRQHLLERPLQCLIGVGTAKNEVKIDSDNSQTMSTSQISDVLSYTKLLIGCSDDDPLSAWWSNLNKMSYNYVYYKDEETACNAAGDVLVHGLTCNKMKSSQRRD